MPDEETVGAAARATVQHAMQVRQLLEAYARQADFAFDAFRQVWKAQNYQRVHAERPPTMSSADYMHCLYSATLAYMQDSFDPYIRVGCAYLLFCLYGTQKFEPDSKPAKIRLVKGV